MRKTNMRKTNEVKENVTMSLTEYLDRSGEYIGLRQFEKYKDERHTYVDWVLTVVPLK